MGIAVNLINARGDTDLLKAILGGIIKEEAAVMANGKRIGTDVIDLTTPPLFDRHLDQLRSLVVATKTGNLVVAIQQIDTIAIFTHRHRLQSVDLQGVTHQMNLLVGHDPLAVARVDDNLLDA